MGIDVRERMRVMENLKIAVLAVQPAQAIERNILSRFERAALTVRAALLAVLAVHPGPFVWTGKDRQVAVCPVCTAKGPGVKHQKLSGKGSSSEKRPSGGLPMSGFPANSSRTRMPIYAVPFDRIR